MRQLWVFVAVACGLGCAKSAPPPGKAVPVENACAEADESRLRVVGYVRYRRGLLSFCSSYGGRTTCDLALHAGPEKPPDFDVMRPRTEPEPPQLKISVPVGDDPGEMDELPEKFDADDVVLHLPDKGKAGEGSRVTIDGKLNVIPPAPNTPPGAPRSCYVNVEWAQPG
jgi:hypothetical protein